MMSEINELNLPWKLEQIGVGGRHSQIPLFSVLDSAGFTVAEYVLEPHASIIVESVNEHNAAKAT